MSRTTVRLQKDLMKIETLDWCEVKLKNDNLFKWIAFIDGPPGTGYENGIFEVHLDFSGFCATVLMKTRTFHLNMTYNGTICLKMVDDDDHEMEDGGLVLLEEVYELMKKPEPTAAINLNALLLYVDDVEEYHAATKMFTNQYARKRKKHPQDDEENDKKDENKKMKENENNNINNGNNDNDEKKDDDSKQDDSKQN